MQEGKATEDKIEELTTWVSTAHLRFGGKPKTACALAVVAVPPHSSKGQSKGNRTPSTNEMTWQFSRVALLETRYKIVQLVATAVSLAEGRCTGAILLLRLRPPVGCILPAEASAMMMVSAGNCCDTTSQLFFFNVLRLSQTPMRRRNDLM